MANQFGNSFYDFLRMQRKDAAAEQQRNEAAKQKRKKAAEQAEQRRNEAELQRKEDEERKISGRKIVQELLDPDVIQEIFPDLPQGMSQSDVKVTHVLGQTKWKSPNSGHSIYLLHLDSVQVFSNILLILLGFC